MNTTPPFKIITYTTDDPDCPANQRAVAHWLDRQGRAQVATQYGPTPEWCAERLSGFLSSEIAKASKSEGITDPEKSAEMRRRALLGAEKRRAAGGAP